MKAEKKKKRLRIMLMYNVGVDMKRFGEMLAPYVVDVGELLPEEKSEESEDEEAMKEAEKRRLETKAKKKRKRAKKEIGLPKSIGSMTVGKKYRSVGRDTLSLDMEDSALLLSRGEYSALYEKFAKEGYILLRGIVPRELISEIQAGAMACTSSEELQKSGGYTVEIAQGSTIRGSDKYVRDTISTTEKKAWKGLGRPISKALHSIDAVLSGLARGREIFERTHLHSVVLFDPLYTWLRIKTPSECTVEHADLYHFLQEAPQLFESSLSPDSVDAADSQAKYTTRKKTTTKHTPLDTKDNPAFPIMGTAWLPLQDMKLSEEGGLALLAKSHTSLDFSKGNHASLPKDFLNKSRPTLQWLATDYKAGDLLIFHMRTVHATPKNASSHPRFSLDTRFLIRPRAKKEDMLLPPTFSSFYHTNSKSIRHLA